MPTNTGHSRRCLAWVNGATIRRAATVADDARAALTCVNDGDYRLRGTNGLDTGEPGATGLWRIAGVCCEPTWDGFRTPATDRHRDASMCLRGEALRHETPPAARTWGTGPGRTAAITLHC